MNKYLVKLAAPLEIIKIITKHESYYLFYALPQIVLNSVLPLLYVYFPKLIIEQLTGSNSYGNIIRTIAIYSFILLFINGTNIILQNKSGICAASFSAKLRNEIGRISMTLELKDIESPKSQEIIQMANKAADLTNAMGLVQNIVSSIITIAGLAYIIVRLDWLFILLVTCTLMIKIIFVRIQYSHKKRERNLEAKNSRYVEYLLNLSYFNEGGAKEIRLNNLQKWYMDKTKTYRDEMVGFHFKSFRLYAFHNIITAVILALQSFVILWMLAGRYIDSIITIADFTMYFSAVTALTVSLSSITELLGNYNQQILNASDYKKFMEMTDIENNDHTAEMSDFALPCKTEIIFQDVSFTYPNSNRQILDNINN